MSLMCHLLKPDFIKSLFRDEWLYVGEWMPTTNFHEYLKYETRNHLEAQVKIIKVENGAELTYLTFILQVVH